LDREKIYTNKNNHEPGNSHGLKHQNKQTNGESPDLFELESLICICYFKTYKSKLRGIVMLEEVAKLPIQKFPNKQIKSKYQRYFHT